MSKTESFRDNHGYLIFLVVFLMMNEIFDTYTTLFYNSIGSYVQEDFQIAESTYAFCIAFASIGMYFVFISQAISDRVGRRPMLFLVLFGMGFSSFILGMSDSVFTFTFSLFLLFIWFSSDIWTIVVSEECPEKHRGKMINLILLGGTLATFIIPFFRSTLIPEFGWRSMTWFALLAMPVAFLTLRVKETRAFRTVSNDDHIEEESWYHKTIEPFTGENRRFVLAITGIGVLTGINYIFLTLGETYLMNDRDLPEDFVSTIIFLMGLAAVIGYILTAFMSDHIGRKPTAVFHILLMPVGVVMVLLGDDLLIAAGAMIVSFSFWSLNITSRLMCLEHFPTEIRGTSNGWRSLSFAVGITLGSFATGLLIPIIGLGNVFLLFSITLLPGILGVYFLKETKGIDLSSKKLIIGE